MTDEVVVVSGFGRCGTTLVMSMLQAGGVPLVEDMAVSHEYSPALNLPEDDAWLTLFAYGRAVKMLDPHRHVPPHGHKYAVLWLDREVAEQARSIAKLLILLHRIPAARVDGKRLEHSLRRDRALARAIWKDRGARMFDLRFERILEDPLGAAAAIGLWVGVPFDARAAAAVVLPRPPNCMPDLSIETLLLQQHESRVAGKRHAVALDEGRIAVRPCAEPRGG